MATARVRKDSSSFKGRNRGTRRDAAASVCARGRQKLGQPPARRDRSTCRWPVGGTQPRRTPVTRRPPRSPHERLVGSAAAVQSLAGLPRGIDERVRIEAVVTRRARRRRFGGKHRTPLRRVADGRSADVATRSSSRGRGGSAPAGGRRAVPRLLVRGTAPRRGSPHDSAWPADGPETYDEPADWRMPRYVDGCPSADRTSAIPSMSALVRRRAARGCVPPADPARSGAPAREGRAPVYSEGRVDVAAGDARCSCGRRRDDERARQSAALCGCGTTATGRRLPRRLDRLAALRVARWLRPLGGARDTDRPPEVLRRPRRRAARRARAARRTRCAASAGTCRPGARAQRVAGLDELRGVRRERRRVAGDVDDPLRRGLDDAAHDLLRQAGARRVDDDDVGAAGLLDELAQREAHVAGEEARVGDLVARARWRSRRRPPPRRSRRPTPRRRAARASGRSSRCRSRGRRRAPSPCSAAYSAATP